MNGSSEQTKIYLKKSCPFCLKLRIFLSEAGIEERFDFVTFDEGDDRHRELRARMEAAGQQPSFPAVEFSPGVLTTETDDLIARFAGEAGVDPALMPLLTYYSEGLFKSHLKMFQELRSLRNAATATQA